MIKLAPQNWSGSVVSLLESVILPQTMDKQLAQAWVDFLHKKANDPKTPLILPAPLPEMRLKRGASTTYFSKSGRPIHFSDNSPLIALATYLPGLASSTPEKMAGLYLQLPFHTFDLERFTKWTGLSSNVQTLGWNAYHLKEPVLKDSWEQLSDEALLQIMIEFLHPANFFIFPHFNKSGALFAVEKRFHDLVKNKYRSHFGEALVALFQNAASETAAEDYSIEIKTEAASASAKSTTKKQMTELVVRLEPSEAYDLKLVTVAEAAGHHSRHLDHSVMARGTYDFKLDFKNKAGEISTVGFFRLNIKDLFEKKYLVHSDEGLKLSIYKGETGFFVAARKNSPAINLPV